MRHGVAPTSICWSNSADDQSLPLVLHRKKQVQDIISYMKWVSAPNKGYMPVEEVLDFVRKTVKGRERKNSLFKHSKR